MVSSFHDTQVGGPLPDRICSPVQLGTDCGQIEVGEIRIGALGHIRFPENLELAARHRSGQPRRQETVILNP